jgi:hypothetical protein
VSEKKVQEIRLSAEISASLTPEQTLSTVSNHFAATFGASVETEKTWRSAKRTKFIAKHRRLFMFCHKEHQTAQQQ